jgi:cytochrome c biogenesis protein CcmG, thiol:disulfide interchange protein DsbE
MTDRPDDARRRRQERRAAARGASVRPGSTSRSSPWLLPLALVGAVVLAAVIAFVLPGSKAPTGGSSSVPPASAGASASTASSVGGSGGASVVPEISGAQLPDFKDPTNDPAVGMAAPEIAGTDFAGKSVRIAHDGRAKAILFIAHWCPHCQREVPLVEAWVKAGGVPAGVDLISVATSIDPNAPNYPPDAWLAREGWTVPVIADRTNAIAKAYGLPAFPYWVYIGPDGKVRGRAVGELPVDQLAATLKGLTGG